MGRVVVFGRVALALMVMVSLTVMALPRAQLAPLGVVNPSQAVIAAGVAAAVLMLIGVALSGPAGPRGPATLGLLVAAGMVAGAAVGATRLPDFGSSVAWLVSLLLVPALVQMSLAWPQGWPQHRFERWLTLATWGVVGVVGLARLAVWDPFADATCVLGCGANPLALHTDPRLARELLDALLVGMAVACLAAAVLVLRRRRFWPGGVACVVLGTDALVRLSTDGPLPQATAVALHQARCGALAVVGGALALAGWTRLRRHGRLVRLAAELDTSPAPGTYEASLRDALGDPTLRISYPVSGQQAFVTADGAPAPAVGLGQATTVLVRSGTPLAVITHEAQHADALAASLGPAARMAIDNERMQAQLQSRLDELRASRERIVEHGDAERLRLERDLHDGAQQRVLMIGYELSRAAQADPSLAAALDPVRRDVATALDELRDIAHGIYPGILESLGLPAALGALADGPVPFQVDDAPVKRLPPGAECAVYNIVSTALGHPQPTREGLPAQVTAAVDLRGDTLHLHLAGLGELPAPLVQSWEDRVGALGGAVHVSGSELECGLPCG